MWHEGWGPGFSTGAAWMDHLHETVAAALEKASAASDRDFCFAYQALVTRLEWAFRTEEARMEEGDAVTLKAHREQHARVLQGLHSAHAQVLQGDLMLGRRIAEELLPRWLSFHIVSMDLPLARSSEAGRREASAACFQPG